MALPFTTGHTAQLDEYVETLATLTECQESETGIRIGYAAAGTTGIVRLSTSTRWPSPAYRAVVVAEYAVDGTCAATGEQLRITHCPRCGGSATLAVERGGTGESFDEDQQKLWIARQYIDRAQPRDESAALFMVSRALARYNKADGGSRPVWIRDQLERPLFAYAFPAKAAAAIERYGRPALSTGIDPLVLIFAARSKDTGLVKGLPYMPDDLRAPPFVGSWGQFALAVFVETADGGLEKLYEQR